MTGKQLRNSILQWAIQGKLVPQDPNDEPASVLLERIRAEKARLVKEKKIKKDKNESVIFRGEDNSYYEKMADGTVRCIDSEIPFDIPDTWAWCRIKTISQSYIGLTYTPSDVSSDGTIVLRSSNIKNGKIELNDLVRVNKEIPIKLRVAKNDIIICARNGSAKLVGKSAIVRNVEEPMTFGAFMAICKTPIYEYVYIFLQSGLFFAQLNCVSSTTTINQLTQNNFNNFLIPIPPIEEQARLIKKLSQLFPLIEQYEHKQNSLVSLNSNIRDCLCKSILQEAIQGRLVPQIASEGTAVELLTVIRAEKEQLVKEGKLKKSVLANENRIFRGEDNRYYEQIGSNTCDITDSIPFEIPYNWEWVRLPHIGTSELGKTMDKGKDYGELTPYLCSINVYWAGVSLEVVKHASFNPSEREKYKLNYGDLLICEGGDVGRCAVWEHHKDMWFQNALHRVLLYGGITPHFVKLVIEYYKSTGEIDRMCKGVTIKHFTQALLNVLLLPLPPVKEQERIVRGASALFHLLK